MKIFLCSRYSRRDELRAYRAQLEQIGHVVCSRWLDTEWLDTAGSSAAPPEYRAQWAAYDVMDVEACDMLIAFTEEPRSDGRGGRHVELGAAIALRKLVHVVGPMENVFCHHPLVQPITWTQLLKELSA